MVLGYWIIKGDKTSCGGSVLEGHPKGQKFGRNLNPQAVQGNKVSCGKHTGVFSVSGGHPGEIIHGCYAASTLYSRSTCPCKAFFIPSQTWAKHGPYQETSIKANGPIVANSSPEPLPTPPQFTMTPKNVADTCTPDDNALLNGVYIWTETKNAGHAFVSVHENNNIFLYTYGRYGRTDPGGFTGDGVLNFLQDEDARVYYRAELYEMGARVFRIDDADPMRTRQFFEDLWNNSKPAIQTASMPETTRRRGRTINGYDVTGSNCTTHSVAGIKFAGSTVFEHGYTSTTTQLPIEAEEDFTVPVSLQKFLVAKGNDMSSMLVVEMTSVFKEQYPNSGNLQSFQETRGGVIQHVAAEAAATGDSLSPYSGGTMGGVLGGSYDNDK